MVIVAGLVLVLEINGEASKHHVGRGDFPKSPTAVKAKAILGQTVEGFDLLAVQFPGGDEFFKFFFH